MSSNPVMSNFFAGISRQNKRYTNMDSAIPVGLEFRESDRSSGTAWVQIPSFTCFYHCKYHIAFQIPILISSTVPTM